MTVSKDKAPVSPEAAACTNWATSPLDCDCCDWADCQICWVVSLNWTESSLVPVGLAPDCPVGKLICGEIF